MCVTPDFEWCGRFQLRDKGELRKITLISPYYGLDIDMDVYNNTALFLSFSEKQPVTVLIDDETIANPMKTIFSYIKDAAEKTKYHIYYEVIPPCCG